MWSLELANPSSQHSAGQKAARLFRQLRDSVLELLGADTHRFPADQLVVTSGGTESNHLALWGLVDWSQERKRLAKPNLVVSAIEHPSIARSAVALAQAHDLELRTIKPDSLGRLHPQDFANAIDEATRLVSVMTANNETGVIQPVREIGVICKARNVLCHTDATQAIGKTKLSFGELGVSAMTLAAHKFHGPLGIGALVIEAGRTLYPCWHAGFQQQSFRPGTESVALLAGMHAALDWYLAHQEEHWSRMSQERDSFEAKLRQSVSNCVGLGDTVQRLPNTSLVAFPGVDRQAFVMAADQRGIACSSGSACASGSSEPSPTLLAMGLEKALVESAIRFSFGALQDAGTGIQAAESVAAIAKLLVG